MLQFLNCLSKYISRYGTDTVPFYHVSIHTGSKIGDPLNFECFKRS